MTRVRADQPKRRRGPARAPPPAIVTSLRDDREGVDMAGPGTAGTALRPRCPPPLGRPGRPPTCPHPRRWLRYARRKEPPGGDSDQPPTFVHPVALFAEPSGALRAIWPAPLSEIDIRAIRVDRWSSHVHVDAVLRLSAFAEQACVFDTWKCHACQVAEEPFKVLRCYAVEW